MSYDGTALLKRYLYKTCPTCVLEKDLVHVGGGVLEQLVVRVEDDHGNLAVAQHTQLVRLE